jgi:ABC-2 type transport system permease protein
MVMLKDSKMKYRGVFSMPVEKSSIWLGKVTACGVLIFLACTIFLILMFIWGFIPPYNKAGYVTSFQLLIASSLLFITFLWQVPLCLFLSAKFGISFTIILNMLCNIIGGATFANEQIWFFPYAIPYCTMGPVLAILPNGLKPDTGSFFLNSSYILPEVLISIALFVAVTALTTVWFRRQEAK